MEIFIEQIDYLHTLSNTDAFIYGWFFATGGYGLIAFSVKGLDVAYDILKISLRKLIAWIRSRKNKTAQ